MIGNSVKGRGFRGCLNYNLNPKKEAQLIGGNMASKNARDLAKEFGEVRQLNQRVKTPCWHISLSAVPGEKLSDAQWNQIADRYLEQMKFDRSRHQYVVIRHSDTKHQHIHIVANRIDIEGQANYLKWHKRDTKKATRVLEQELTYLEKTCQTLDQARDQLEKNYQLSSVISEQKRGVTQGQYWRVQREQISQLDQPPTPIMQQRLQGLIDQALFMSTTLEDFKAHLTAQQVEVRFRTNLENETVGISYQLDGVALPGTALGPGYSWSSIRERLQIQQTQQQTLDPVQSNTQLSLFPGVDHELQRQSFPRRQPTALDGEGYDAQKHSKRHRASQKTAQSHGERLPVLPADGAVEPKRSVRERPQTDSGTVGRLEELTRSFRELASELAERHHRDRRDAAEQRPTDERGNAVLSTDARHIDSGRRSASESTERHQPSDHSIKSTAAPGRGEADQQLSDPPGTGAEVSESAQPRPSVFEWAAAWSQGAFWDVHADRSMSDGDHRAYRDDDLEFTAAAIARADQWEDEQSRDQPEEDSESTTVTEQQEILTVLHRLDDEKLLVLECDVNTYFKRQPPEPDWSEGERLSEALKQSGQQRKQLLKQGHEMYQHLEELGIPRSLMYPFGASPNEVKKTKAAFKTVERQLYRVQANQEHLEQDLRSWQKAAQRYGEWRDSDLGQKIHRVRDGLKLSSVQERLTQLHGLKERQQVLQSLQNWEQIAIRLGKPKVYLDRIRGVAADYQQSGVFSDSAMSTMRADFKAEQQLRVERYGLSLGW